MTPAVRRGLPGTAGGSAPPPSQQSGPSAEAAPSAPTPASPTAPFRARLLTVPGVGEGAPGRRSAARGPFGRTVGARVPQSRPFALHIPATVRAAVLRGAGPARRRTAPRSGWPRPTCARRCGRAGRATWSCSPWTPAGRWRPGSGCARSRARSCPCCSTPTSAATRWAWSRSAVPAPRSRCRPPPRWRRPPRRLTSLATGGRTPLAAGLAQAARVLATERLRDPRRRALLVVVTDGRATSGSDADLAGAPADGGRHAARGIACVVVDCESSVLRLGLSGRLAVMLGAPAIPARRARAGPASPALARQLTHGRAA